MENNFKSLYKRLLKIYKTKGGISTGMLYAVGILILLVGGGMMFAGDSPVNRISQGTQPVTIVPYTPEPSKNNLQLYTLEGVIPTVAPTATYCSPDTKKTPACTCVPYEAMTASCEEPCSSNSDCSHKDGKCFKGFSGIFGSPTGSADKTYCQYIYFSGDQERNDPYFDNPKCQTACVGKPVIYLYPLKDTFVNVTLPIPGTIVESDPLYPPGGWRNVLAHPSGKLDYRGKSYKELYYETAVGKIRRPSAGIVLAMPDLEKELVRITTRLGLLPSEQGEFLYYWLPRLKALNSTYILFSLIDPIEKERIDHVNIYPKPDTFIGFIAYFMPLNNPHIPLASLELPDNPPARIGFTAVEWGGTISYDQE